MLAAKVTRPLVSEMAWLSQPQQNPIRVLLEQEGTTVANVLDDKGFAQALRSSDEKLCKFLSQPQNIEEIFKIAFTDQRECVQRMRQAVTALSTSAGRLQNELVKQDRFWDILNGFPESEFATNPRSCGHFQRIIDCYVRFRTVDLCARVTSLRKFLVEHMHCLSLRNLFVTLVSEFSEPFNVDVQLFRDVVAQMRNGNGYFLAGALLMIFQTDKHDVTSLFKNPELVGDLLDVAVNGGCSVMATSLTLKLLTLIMEQDDVPEEAVAKVKEYGEKYSFDGPPAVVVEAARLFRDKTLSLVDRLLSNNNTFLNEVIVAAFEKLSPEEQNEFANQNGLCEKVMTGIDGSEKRKTDGYLLKMAQVMSEIPSEKRTGSLNDARWTEFVNNTLAQQLKQLKASDPSDKQDTISSESESGSDDDFLQRSPTPTLSPFGDESSSDTESESESDSSDSLDFPTSPPDSPTHENHRQMLSDSDDDDEQPSFESPEGNIGGD